MIELKVINKIDPIKRSAEKQNEVEEFSPMDPPNAYNPLNVDVVPYDDLHPFLQNLNDEHKSFITQLDELEQVIIEIKTKGFDKDIFSKLRDFFEFFDREFIAHNKKEEKSIFPILHERLVREGEHGIGSDPLTAITMMEDDHIKALQLATIVFNFLGMAMKLPDADSRLILLDVAVEQAKALIELLRLHIFREDNIVFGLAHKYITSEEFDTFLVRSDGKRD